MKRISVGFTTGFLFALVLSFHSSKAQTPKESSLITHLVNEANQPDAHTVDDAFLLVKIGKVDYIADLKTGKIISQHMSINGRILFDETVESAKRGKVGILVGHLGRIRPNTQSMRIGIKHLKVWQ